MVGRYHFGVAIDATLFFEQSLASARESGNRAVIPSVLNGMAFIAREGEDFGRAQGLWEEALALARKQGDVFEAATILKNMGYTELARSNQERATALTEEALVLGRKIENNYMVADCLMILGIADTLRGDPQHAEELLREGLAVYLELGLKTDIAEGLEGLAETAGALGEDVRAARLWGRLREAFGVSWTLAESLLHEPQQASARARLDEAAWEAAFAEGRAMELEEAVEYALSRREQEVAKLVARGLTNRQIAKELVLSERTVENHVSNILKKLKLSSRSEVAAWVEAL